MYCEGGRGRQGGGMFGSMVEWEGHVSTCSTSTAPVFLMC
jgi:hypothetical protein